MDQTVSLWRSIYLKIRDDIKDQHYSEGKKLPTEQQLAVRFGVNRHTIRRALAELAKEKIVFSRRGSGVFQSAKVTDYKLSARTRFNENLKGCGEIPSISVIRLEVVNSTKWDAVALGIKQSDQVILREAIGFRDKTPVVFKKSMFPHKKFPMLLNALKSDTSITGALQKVGVIDYKLSKTTISAQNSDAIVSNHLKCEIGSPLIRTNFVNLTLGGEPIELGYSLFVGDRINLVYET